jgi:WD40 repeat protein
VFDIAAKREVQRLPSTFVDRRGRFLVNEDKLTDTLSGSAAGRIPKGELDAFVSDGDTDRAAAAYKGGPLRVVDMRSGSIVCSVKTSRSAAALEFAPDHKTLVAGMGANLIAINAVNCAEKWRLELPGEVLALAFDRRGERLAVSGLDGSVRILEAATGKARARIPVAQEARSVAFTPDGREIVYIEGLSLPKTPAGHPDPV